MCCVKRRCCSLRYSLPLGGSNPLSLGDEGFFSRSLPPDLSIEGGIAIPPGRKTEEFSGRAAAGVTTESQNHVGMEELQA